MPPTAVQMSYQDVPRPTEFWERDPHTQELRPARHTPITFPLERSTPFWRNRNVVVPYSKYEVAALINRIWKGKYSQSNTYDESYIRLPTNQELHDLFKLYPDTVMKLHIIQRYTEMMRTAMEDDVPRPPRGRTASRRRAYYTDNDNIPRYRRS